MKRFRLTPMQEAMLFEQANSQSRYVSVLRYELPGKIDADKLRQRASLLAARHETLRTAFVRDDDGVFWQQISDQAEVDFCAVDRFEENGENPPEIAPFKDKLFRLVLCGNELVVIFSHIILDGWSVSVLMRELLSEAAPTGKATPFRYYVKWLQSRNHPEDLRWWKDYLGDLNPQSKLPDADNTGGYVREGLRFELTDSERLRKCASGLRVTAGRLVQAVWCMLIARYNGGDSVVGCVTAGRSAPVPGITGMVGMCVNTIPIATRLPKPPDSVTFTEWIAEWNQNTVEAEKHGFCRLGDLIKSPMSHILAIDPSFDGKDFRLIRTNAELVTDFDAVITLSDTIAVEFAYNGCAYSAEAVDSIRGHFLTALAAVVEDPSIPVEQIPILTETEQTYLTNIQENREILDVIENRTIVDLFSESARLSGGRPAVVSGDAVLSYEALAALSDTLAYALNAQGVGAEVPVAIKLHRGERYVISELAVLKAGGFFIPLDPEWPEERIQTILDEVHPFIVVDEIAYEQLLTAAVQRANLPMPKPDDAAYMIMTSGTTGIPKGVVVTHKNLANFCLWAKSRYAWQTGDACAMVLGFGFDGSMWDIWLPLLSGGTLHVLRDSVRFSISALGEYCRGHHITHIDLPVTLAESFFEIYTGENALENLRAVVVGGEEVRHAVTPEYAVSNEYGPTECTVCCCTAWIGGEAVPVPIGAPPANMHAYILDEWLRLCPDGVEGEAYFSGVQVARGYYNAPELTAQRFTENPFAAGDHAVLYKSGDLMRWRHSGGRRELMFLGRTDGQIKINGFRVELGEIESVLREEPGVGAVVAAARETAAGENRLCAYVVPDGEIDLQGLSLALAAKLPAFMHPAIVVVDSIPLSASGKVDYDRLPAPEPMSGTEYLRPETEKEKMLVDAVSRVLNTENVGIAHNYIELGGNSINAMRIAFLLEKEGFELAAGDIIASKTLAELAPKMRAAGVQQEEAEFSKDVFTPLSAQKAMIFLAETAGSSAYTVTLRKPTNGVSVEELQRRLRKSVHLHDILRATFEYGEGGDVLGRVREDADIVVRPLEHSDPANGINPLHDPLLDVSVCGDELVIRYHHIALDGWSADLLARELLQGKFPESAPSFAQFANRLAHQKGRQAADEAWWQNNVENAETVELFSSEDSTPSEYRRVSIGSDDLFKRCLDAAHRAHVTPAAFTLAAWGVALHTLENVNGDILIPFVASCRDDDNLMGMCAAEYPLRFCMEKIPFDRLAQKVQGDVLECARHIFVPQRVIRGIPRYLFVFEDGAGDLSSGPSRPDGIGEQNYDLVVKFGCNCELIYNPNKLSDERIRAVAERLEAAIRAAVDGRVSAFLDGEHELVTETFARGRMLKADYETPLQALEAAARAYAGCIALESEDTSLTYAELYGEAKHLADRLNADGISSGDVVAICMGRSTEAIIAHMGIVLSGAAFLPLDPSWPSARTDEILLDAGAALVIRDALVMEKTERRGKVPEDSAYIIYTSGTTGKPKGAVLTKRALANQIAWSIDEFGFHPGDKMLHYVAFTFDPSVWTMFVTLSSGATLSVIPESARLDPQAVAGFALTHRITMCTLPAAVGIDVMRHLCPVDGLPLRIAFIGGETIRNLPARAAYPEIVNVYGPTEACVNSAFYRMKPEETQTRNIGVPVANTQCYVLGVDGEPCPVGVPGELCIGGIQLAHGYLNRPEENAAAFVEHPVFGRIYRTGDRAAWNRDGTLEFLGRNDGQIKIRGNRVEIGEIEHALCALPEIADAKIKLSGERPNAYVIWQKGVEVPNVATVRQKLGDRLPSYMLPNTVTALESFPLTRHGKIDYAALPEAKGDASVERSDQKTSSDEESAAASAWRTVLPLGPDFYVPKDASFFELGGHSLMLFQVVGVLAAVGIKVSIKTLIDNPTLAELEEVIRRQPAERKTNNGSGQSGAGYERYVRESLDIDLSERRTFSNILITGGTGFLGCHVIWEFYHNTDAVMYLPVRGGADRIADALAYYYGGKGAEIAGSKRLHVFECDISEIMPPCEGVALDAIFHTAADVRHYAPDEETYKANVTATEIMLAFAEKQNSRYGKDILFAHVSTTGAINAPVIHENDTDMGPLFDNMYQRSKQIAEQRIFEAASKGVKYAIFRVGNLTPAFSTMVPARTTNINSLLRLTKAMFTTGLRAEPDGHVGYVFVDETARAIRLLSEPKCLENRVFHLANPNTISFARLFELAGIKEKALPKDELLAALRALMQSSDGTVRNAATDYLGRISQISLEKSETSDVIEGDLMMEATLSLLQRLGFEWPKITGKYAKVYNSIV